MRSPRSLLRSVSYRLAASRDRINADLQRRKEQGAFRAWTDGLRRNRIEVLVGANFAEFGGVRHHIHAIERYSSLRVGLAPSDKLLETVTPHMVKTRFKEDFLRFDTSGMKAIHSHVFPWFIEWCSEKRKPGLRWIHTYHLPYFPELGEGEQEPWQYEFNEVMLRVARHADLRLSVSRWQRQYLLDEHSIDTVYLPNGVDVAQCDTARPERFTAATGLTDFVLYAGRAELVKNPADFVRLAAQMPSTRFVMIGPGLSPATLLTDFNVVAPSNLRVLGAMSHSNMLDAIAASRAVVVTSLREGLPTLVLEAMALEKPVVVPDERGCVEAVDGGRYGFVYQPGDISDLAEKTTEAMNDSERCAGARARVLEEYDWRVVSAQLDAFYRGDN